MLKKNAFWFGLLAGFLFPAAILGVMLLLNLLTDFFARPPFDLTLKKILFASVALNILPVRYYFTKDMEGTAKGILFITVVLIIGIVFVL